MMSSEEPRSAYRVDVKNLPDLFPTHLHQPSFWECLGRSVATFGMLEDALARAIFAFTATRHYPPDEIDQAFQKWIPQLEKAISDTLNSLINTYASTVRAHQNANFQNLDDLVADLKAASKVRNAICHGAWNPPDDRGFSELRYFSKGGQYFDTPIDKAFLLQLQRHTAELICNVVNSVTMMGFQFPGSSGPGHQIL